jgi:hypothetical protein
VANRFQCVSKLPIVVSDIVWNKGKANKGSVRLQCFRQVPGTCISDATPAKIQASKTAPCLERPSQTFSARIPDGITCESQAGKANVRFQHFRKMRDAYLSKGITSNIQEDQGRVCHQ